MRQGWQDKQAAAQHSTEHSRCERWKWPALAARAWSWLPSWGSWRCSSAAPPTVSERGRPALGKRFSAPLCGAPAHAGVCVLAAGRGRGGRELFQRSTLPNPLLLWTGSWIVRGLTTDPNQHGTGVQKGFINLVGFPSFQHKATRTAACLTPKCACLGGP